MKKIRVASVLVLLSAGLFLAACGDEDTVPTGAAETPTSIEDAATPTPLPPTATPVPPTATHVPPSPTPTPTVEELKLARLAQFSWYSSKALSSTDRQTLIDRLCDMAINQPMLFERVVELSMMRINTDREAANIALALDQLLQIGRIDEESAIKVSQMRLMNGAQHGAVQTLVLLTDLAEIAQADFPAFLAHADVPNDIPSVAYLGERYPEDLSPQVTDLFLPFLQAADPDAASRIESLEWFGAPDQGAIRRISGLAVFYPEVFASLMDNLGLGYLPWNHPIRAWRLAEIDEQTAVRVAGMPFWRNHVFLTTFTGLLLERSMELDLAGTNAIFDTYEEEGGIEWTELPDAAYSVIGVVHPDLYEAMASLDWVSNGISHTRYEEWNERRTPEYTPYVGEDYALTRIVRAAAGEDISYLLRLFELPWIQERLTGDEILFIEEVIFLAVTTDVATANLLMGMQYVQDDVTYDDRTATGSIGSLARSAGVDYRMYIERLLDDSRIGGEITDRNVQFVGEIVLELRAEIAEP